MLGTDSTLHAILLAKAIFLRKLKKTFRATWDLRVIKSIGVIRLSWHTIRAESQTNPNASYNPSNLALQGLLRPGSDVAYSSKPTSAESRCIGVIGLQRVHADASGGHTIVVG